MDMQTEKTSDKEQPRAMTFSCVGESLYQLRPEASQLDILCQLQARLSQLDAMLTHVTGNGSETFQNWNDRLQDNYLWGCRMITNECKDLAGHIDLSRK
jgi:hypothetical protein